MNNLSDNHLKIDDNIDEDIYHESWGKFGTNLKDYIKSNKEDLINDSYDVILGFSRGGTILAYSFTCLLQDLIDEYHDKYKACIRPIPKGFTCKKNNPCFVMDHPASDDERIDITTFLENDLIKLSGPHTNKINVLIIDDNLTGATRVRFLEDELKKMNCVESVKTLAYVKHISFSPISTIIEFPKDRKIFVMPWHKPHSKKELDLENEDIEGYEMNIFIKVDNQFNRQHFIEEIEKYYTLKGEGKNYIINGASNFLFNEKKIGNDNFVDVMVSLHMFYPPKHCLKSEDSDNTNEDLDVSKFRPICSFGFDKTMSSCVTCSHLNCNKKLIKRLLNATNSQTISFELKNNPELKSAVKEWFNNSLPEIKLMEFSND